MTVKNPVVIAALIILLAGIAAWPLSFLAVDHWRKIDATCAAGGGVAVRADQGGVVCVRADALIAWTGEKR